MIPERWRQAMDIFDAALQRRQAERDTFIEASCAKDDGLAQAVHVLLSAHEDAAGFGSAPVMSIDAQVTSRNGFVQGQILGDYRIEQWLGCGGMGEVYRARDLKLERDVAIKFLQHSVAHDSSCVAQLRREAQLLASLNHAHIAVIHQFEDAGVPPYLVLEYVDGETLAARLKQTPLRVEEAIAIAEQLADALDAAHEKGVVHCDLKPSNIALTKDAKVKVLDFGLATWITRRTSESGQPIVGSPTGSSADVGAVRGTAAYLSPERIKGRSGDRRSDVWAFGCILFEMLAGRRAFDSTDEQETLADVLTREPDWAALPATTPAHVRRLLERCLQKDRTLRLRDIGDARLELTAWADIRDEKTFSRERRRWATFAKAGVSAAVLAVGTAALVLGLTRWPSSDREREQRFLIDLPDSTSAFGEPAIAPDGTRLVYAAGTRAVTRLYMRTLNDIHAHPLAGTDGAVNPFFSPDGQWIGFFADEGLKKISVNGGAAVTLSETSFSAGAVWAADDTIVFATRAGGKGSTWVGSTLHRVSAHHPGSPTILTSLDADQYESHDWPEILPGGTILFSATRQGSYADGRVDALSPKTGKIQTVIERGYHARYVPSGHLIYALGHDLMAVQFDVNRLVTVGSPVRLVENIAVSTVRGSASFAVSQSGTLIYMLPEPVPQKVLAWVDRDGHEQPFDMPADNYSFPRLSPDGTRVALGTGPVGATVISIWDIAERRLSRLTWGSGIATAPVWTRDGRHLVFYSNENGGMFNVYRHASDGTGQTVRLTTTPKPQLPHDISPDGTRIVVQELNENTGTDLSLVSMADGVETPFLASQAGEFSGRISPNGRWIAYTSDEAGSFQVHVRPFTDPSAGHWLVSENPGRAPVWSSDGRELFFVTREPQPRALWSVSVRAGEAFSAGSPRKLLDWPYSAAYYDVSKDGRRFLAVKDVEAAKSQQAARRSQLMIVMNWSNGLPPLASAGLQP
jgi:Tol biopolymer transport system component